VEPDKESEPLLDPTASQERASDDERAYDGHLSTVSTR
jgi:hypothetical protein